MVITISGKAHIKLVELIAQRKTGKYLRLSCLGGGCSGISYSIEVQEDKKDSDTLLTVDGICIIIDPKSAVLIDGLDIDYSTNLNNMGFVFKNPQAKHTCGCGMSFSL